jgi:hypothetical protein
MGDKYIIDVRLGNDQITTGARGRSKSGTPLHACMHERRNMVKSGSRTLNSCSQSAWAQ